MESFVVHLFGSEILNPFQHFDARGTAILHADKQVQSEMAESANIYVVIDAANSYEAIAMVQAGKGTLIDYKSRHATEQEVLDADERALQRAREAGGIALIEHMLGCKLPPAPPSPPIKRRW